MIMVQEKTSLVVLMCIIGLIQFVNSKYQFYCDMCCVTLGGKICNQHTMCIYSPASHGPNCNGYYPLKLTEEEKKEVLNAHNVLRNRVALGLETLGINGHQPHASDMREMVWDEELAAIAQRWVDQCLMGHDRCRDVSRFPVGQNVAGGSIVVLNLTSHVLGWYSQVENFDASLIKSFKLGTPGELAYSSYSQLVWGDSYSLGCARAIYHTGSSQVHYMEHLTCNYGPLGNIPTSPVYTIGKPCSSCPEGSQCGGPKYPGLCANVKRATLKEQCGESKDPNDVECRLELALRRGEVTESFTSSSSMLASPFSVSELIFSILATVQVFSF